MQHIDKNSENKDRKYIDKMSVAVLLYLFQRFVCPIELMLIIKRIYSFQSHIVIFTSLNVPDNAKFFKISLSLYMRYNNIYQFINSTRNHLIGKTIEKSLK